MLTKFIELLGATFVFLLFSCAELSGKVGGGMSFAEDVLSCEPTLDPRALRPAVCGRCEIKVEEGRLVIQETKECLRYEVYRCRRKDRTTFLINNFRCQPFEEKDK